jgi:hypothetical protein
MPRPSNSTHYDPPWVVLGDYAFICHADKDKTLIDELKLVPEMTRHGVKVVIDRLHPTIKVDDLTLVHTFRGGREWRSELEFYVQRARCVLILWSENMQARVQAEPNGGRIGQEILTGLRNGTAFFCWLDGNPLPEKICTTLEAKMNGFNAEFREAIESRQILPLARPSAANPRRGRLEMEMKALAYDIYAIISPSPRGERTIDAADPRLNKLLNLIDRDDVVTRIVERGIVHVVSGREPQCRVHDLIQRLKEIELPPTHRARGRNWRAEIVRDGFDPDTAWVHRRIEWPVMAAPASDQQKFDAAVADGLDKLLSNIAVALELTWEEELPAKFAAALTRHLASSADAFLLCSYLGGEATTGDCDVELVKRLGSLFDSLPSDKFRIMLAMLDTEKKSNFLSFWKKAPPHPLAKTAARLDDLRPTDLINWAGLTEAVVRRPSNKIMDVINDIYAKHASSTGERALSMQAMRETLEGFVLNWLIEASSKSEAQSRPGRLVRTD